MRGVILFFSLALLASCDNFGTLSDEEYVTRAQEFLDKGELNAASIELKNALSQNSDNSQARWLLGNTYLELGNGPAAEKELRRARELGMADEAIIIPLGKSLLLQGKISSIISEIQPLGSLSADKLARIQALRGTAFIYEGKLEDAAAELQSAIDLSGDLTEAQIAYAHLDMVRGNGEEARNWIDTALANAPESADAWSLLGNLELVEGNASEAETAFSSAIKLRKFVSEDVAKRALARILLKNYPDAEADIQTLKQGGLKDHPYINYIAGISYFNQKKYPEAEEAFQASYGKLQSLPVEFYLATTHNILGHQVLARRFSDLVLAKAPRSVKAMRLRGAIELRLSEYDAATEVLQKSLLRSPDDVTTLRMLATASLLKGDSAKGVQYSQRIVSLEPESRQAKEMLMMAKLIDGEALDQNVAGVLGQAYKGDNFTEEFLYAVEAFRDRKLGQALERARKLHEKYPDNVEPLKLMAASYLAEARWDKARIELEKALAIQPNEPSAMRNLAFLEVQEGNLERARALLKALIEEHKGDEGALSLLADIEDWLGNQAVSTQILEQALERNPNALSLRVQLARYYLRAGKAVRVLEVTQGLNDKQLQEQPSFLELRGRAYMSTGELGSARYTFQRWTEVAPDSLQAHFLYADSLTKSGEINLALKALERVIQLDPDYVPARVGEIKALVHAGEMESANKALGNLRRDFGPRPEVLGIEGWFALGTGDYATAADRFSAIEEQNRYTETTILLVRSLWLQEKYDEAVGVMQTWLKGHPNDVAVLLHLAGGYLSLNKEEEAIPLYARVVELMPNHLSALNNLAWLSRDKDYKQAIGYAERAYQLSPDDPYVLDTYGVLLMKGGDALLGYSMIKKAAERLPEDLTIQLHLGRSLVQQEKFTEAQSVLSALVNKAPDTQSANEAKVLLESILQH